MLTVDRLLFPPAILSNFKIKSDLPWQSSPNQECLFQRFDLDGESAKDLLGLEGSYFLELVLSSAAFKPFANFSGLSTAQKCIMNKRGSSCNM